jgi:hypothetical protein
MACSIWDVDKASSELVDLLYDHTEGIPFYVIEFAYAMESKEFVHFYEQTTSPLSPTLSPLSPPPSRDTLSPLATRADTFGVMALDTLGGDVADGTPPGATRKDTKGREREGGGG